MDLPRTITLVWAQYRAFRAAVAELESYSARELDELGITRGDIPRIAYEEAERRVEALAASRPRAQALPRVVGEARGAPSLSFRTRPSGRRPSVAPPAAASC